MKKKTPNKTSLKVVISMFLTSIVWSVVYGLFEIKTLLDKVPNNTVSHTIDFIWQQYPALPYVLSAGFVTSVLFWAVVLGHWFIPNFPWKRAKWVDENDGRTDLQIKKDDHKKDH